MPLTHHYVTLPLLPIVNKTAAFCHSHAIGDLSPVFVKVALRVRFSLSAGVFMFMKHKHKRNCKWLAPLGRRLVTLLRGQWSRGLRK